MAKRSLVFLLLIISVSVNANIIYVKQSAAGSNNGNTWNDAYNNLQSAISVATSGDSIWIAAGTYTPSTTDRSISFNLKNGVTIIGGFAGNETNVSNANWELNQVILSGEINSGSASDNSYHIVRSENNDATAILNGVYIRAANANGSGYDRFGGGILFIYSNATITNCSLENNNAENGGGISVNDGSSPTITNVSIMSNTAYEGGGIFISSFGLAANPSFNNCYIQGNSAVKQISQYGLGGGVYVSCGPVATAVNPSFTNCLITGNKGFEKGGGLYIQPGINDPSKITVALLNCTVVSNNGSNEGGGFYATQCSMNVKNCLIRDNSSGYAIDGSVNFNATYSALFPFVAGTGNVDQSPAYFNFVSPFSAPSTGGDYHLADICSPLYNSGNNANVSSTDLDGRQRIYGVSIDIGCYEKQSPQGRVYVSASATGANTGTDWQNAFTNLQTALAYSSCVPLEIWVSSGTYKPGNSRSSTFNIPSGVKLYGGFNPYVDTAYVPSNNFSTTYLDGDIGIIGSNKDNCYHVVTFINSSSNTSLDGFDIRNGYADGLNTNEDIGAGIFITTTNEAAICSPIIKNCSISYSRASYAGGGVCIYPQVKNSTLNPVLNKVYFIEDTSFNGSAIALYSDSTGTSASITGSQNTIRASYALAYTISVFGTGSLSSSFINSIISGNYSSYASIYSSKPIEFRSCTIASNSNNVFAFYGNVPVKIYNSIIWGNRNMFYNNSATLDVQYSDMQNAMPGTGNVSIDPGFVSISHYYQAGTFQINDNYTLTNCSALKNIGNSSLTPATTDYLGMARVFNAQIDMGAIELQNNGSPNKVYVKYNAAGVNDGSSWVNAFTTLSAALNTCAQEIWVAEGTYKPTNNTDKTLSFTLDYYPRKLYGGFAGTETSLSERNIANHTTLISGDLNGDDVGYQNQNDNSYHLFKIENSKDNIIDGFTFSGGNASAVGNNEGGAILLNNNNNVTDSTGLTLMNCNFMYNQAIGDGGAVKIYIKPTALGIRYATFMNCDFKFNKGYNGGAVAGYGISNSGILKANFESCRFRGNESVSAGSAIFINAPDVNRMEATAKNCLIAGNYSGDEGSFWGGGNGNIINCTITANGANGNHNAGLVWTTGPNKYCVIINCILKDNKNLSFSYSDIARVQLYYSNVENNTAFTGYSFLGLRYEDPKFINAASTSLAPTVFGDYHLKPCSALINGGHEFASINYTNLDADQKPRKVNGFIDIGAYENQGDTLKAYVRKNATGNYDGSSWANAFNEVRSALAAYNAGTACFNELWVAEGKYTPGTNEIASFNLYPNLKLIGGFAGNESSITERAWSVHPTILSGDVLGNDNTNSYTDNSLHVIKGGGNLSNGTVLDGFIVEGGNAYGSAYDGVGGGLLLTHFGNGYRSSPTIRNCTFRKNGSTQGGGVYLQVNGSAYLTPTFINCSFIENTALSNGGAIYATGYSTVPSDNNLLSITYKNCAFKGNSASSGGAIKIVCNGTNSSTYTNCLFSGNKASTNAGAIYTDGDPEFVNTTIAGNSAPTGGAIYYTKYANVSNNWMYLRNSILSGNSSEIYVQDPTNSTVYRDNSNTENNYSGAANSSYNYQPAFIDARSFTSAPFVDGNYNLSTCSPLIDKGNNAFIHDSTDVAGNARFKGNVDMGAYEEQATAQSINVSNTSVSANIECIDEDGWTHYYNTVNNVLLLSVKKNGQNIGSIGDGTFEVKITTTQNYNTGSATNLSNAQYITDGSKWYVANRRWNVTATTQPAIPVNIRFYYSNADNNDLGTTVNNITPNTYKGDSSMQMFKLDNTNNAFSTTLPATDFHLYNYSNNISANNYVLGNYAGRKYGEYIVSSFSGGGIGMKFTASSLPVTLLKFSGVSDKRTAQLKWSTSTEINTLHFELERSFDGGTFSKITELQAAGNSNTIKNYSYPDINIGERSGVVYYRLRTVDKDGRYKFSNIVKLSFKQIENGMTVYPNPAVKGTLLNVSFSTLRKQNISIQLLDATGKTMFQKQATATSGNNLVNITLPLNIIPGLYIIRMVNDEGISSARLIIQ